MKYQDLVEMIYTRFPSQYDPSREVLVFKNPSKNETINARQRATNNELRGILVGNALYVWDADLALHDEVATNIGFTADAKFIIDEHGRYIDSGDVPNDISNHPMLKRALGLP